MSGVTLTATFDDGPMRRHLAALALLHATGYDRARREIGEFLVGEVQDNLDRQRLVDGSAMPQSKAAIKRKGKTLIDKRHLYDSYVYQLLPEGLEVGSAKKYAAIHHYGGVTGRRSHRFVMQARPVLGLSANGERELTQIMVDEIRRAQG